MADTKYLPDTKEQVAQTTKAFIVKLADAFRRRIAIVKR